MVAVFYLSRSVHNEIIKQAIVGFPHEVCGFLAGPNINYGLQSRPAKNVSLQPQVAYNIMPEETLAALLQFEHTAQRLTGIYHSHPNYPAIPSKIDLRLADLPDACYLILSVRDEPNNEFQLELRGYRIQSPNSFYEVQIELID